MNKLLIICGPTATGKTKLGIDLAKKFNGEIVSADSRQVYKGMDVGTGKDVRNCKLQIANCKSIFNDKFQIGFYEVNGIKIWLLDIVEPSYKFNVADYKKCADLVIKDILDRGKLPVIVGGTGFYIKALVDGIETMGVPPDWKLRDELQSYEVSELQSQLKELDSDRWERMNESDRQNPRRLIRAIEIARKCKVQSAKCKIITQNSKLDTFFIGLTASFPMLYQRIDQRVEERVKDGLENEIKSLLAEGYNFENSVLGTTLAYSEWKDFIVYTRNTLDVNPRMERVPTKSDKRSLNIKNTTGVSSGIFIDKKASKEKTIQKWKFDEHNYARRQMTWFKKDKRINWFDIFDANIKSKVENMVNNWYIKVDA